MINHRYSFDDYVDPISTYKILSDKLKLGHLIFNKNLNKIQRIDLDILIEIKNSEINKENQNYFLIILSEKWLTKIFNFNKKYLNMKYMNIFSSNFHGLKIHEKNRGFSLGYLFKEKINNISGMRGQVTYKPKIFFVNELMDYMFLIKKEQFNFSKDDMDEINKQMVKSIRILEFKN